MSSRLLPVVYPAAHVTRGSFCPSESSPLWHVDQFSRFVELMAVSSRQTHVDRQSHRYADRATSVTLGCI